MLQQFRDCPQRVVDRVCGGKLCRDVRVQNDDVRAGCVPARVLATDTVAEIVLAAHAISQPPPRAVLLLHVGFAHAE